MEQQHLYLFQGMKRIELKPTNDNKYFLNLLGIWMYRFVSCIETIPKKKGMLLIK